MNSNGTINEGYSKVISFLNAINERSPKTGKTYASAMIHLENFITEENKYNGHNSNSIVDAILGGKVGVYELLGDFISYIKRIKVGITSRSIVNYLAALRSYFAYHDIDIIPSKFKRKVFVPRIYREDEEPLDVADIRKILLSCSNRRLKTYLLVLASGGMRTVEALAIRNKDIDFTISPTKIHIRKEYTKTKVARDVYISEEATYHLKQWLDWKYKNPDRPREFKDNDLIFTVYQLATTPQTLYQKCCHEFQKLLKTVGMDERKDTGVNKRRKITLHSFRRHCKTVISTQVGQDYSEWFLGHAKSPYWTLKESERRKIYGEKIMKYLTFLDYSTLEATGKNIEAQLDQKDREISYLSAAIKERDQKFDAEMKAMNERMARIDAALNKVQRLEKELGIN